MQVRKNFSFIPLCGKTAYKDKENTQKCPKNRSAEKTFIKNEKISKNPLTFPLFVVIIYPVSKNAPLAQLVEQLTLNQWVQGSSPWRCTNKKG